MKKNKKTETTGTVLTIASMPTIAEAVETLKSIYKHRITPQSYEALYEKDQGKKEAIAKELLQMKANIKTIKEGLKNINQLVKFADVYTMEMGAKLTGKQMSFWEL